MPSSRSKGQAPHNTKSVPGNPRERVGADRRQGKQTLAFSHPPVILATASVVGPKEGQGPLGQYFDSVKDDTVLGQKSWELAEKKMFIEAAQLAAKKAGLGLPDIHFLFGGDLLNQIITASFAASELSIPFVGLYGACATMAEALALSAIVVDGGYASYAMAVSSSHHDTAERQYRYPTEFGVQPPPEAQWTVTAAGAAIVGYSGSERALAKSRGTPLAKQNNSPADTGRGSGGAPETSSPPLPIITHATLGKVVDMGVKNPWDMGSAMAPAASETIWQHLQDTGRSPSDYDLILTGDLGKVGSNLLVTLLKETNVDISGKHADCGLLIFDQTQGVESGGSGCGCSAVVFASYIINEMIKGKLRRVLLVATGSLHSPTSIQQGESMPCIAHAVAIEVPGGKSRR